MMMFPERPVSVSPSAIACGLAVWLWAFSPSPALCNDSDAMTPLGGLVLLKNDSIVMASEDLFISAKQVRVRYRYINESDRDIETTVAFPLPVISPDDNLDDNRKFWSDASTMFKTMVDGRPVELTVVERAFLGGSEVTGRLRAASLPINWYSQGFQAAVKALPEADRRELVDEKLLDGNGDWRALWEVRTTITRRQTFPAHKPVIVEHEYTPLAGSMIQPIWSEGVYDNWKDVIRDYCIEDDWLKSAKKKASAANVTEGNDVIVRYVLTTGANWKGPIRDFHLVIDKGEPDVLMSFCEEGAVKKISQTQFEVHKTNFTPTRDLDILFLHLRMD